MCHIVWVVCGVCVTARGWSVVCVCVTAGVVSGVCVTSGGGQWCV